MRGFLGFLCGFKALFVGLGTDLSGFTALWGFGFLNSFVLAAGRV